jgi:glycosyltransferase involved in cell wall biosynthesis
MSQKDLISYPKISIIVPSFNQVKFLERTIVSIINQNYLNYEIIIIDGGSTDGSVDIIKKYQENIFYWVSEKDNGQTHAINKGLKKANGDWLCWQNSDDIFFENCFLDLAKIVVSNKNLNFVLGNLVLIDENDNVLKKIKYVKPNFHSIFHEGMVISNQCAFWNKSVHSKIGYLNEDYSFAFDFEWFLRLSSLGKIKHFNSFWGGFRIQPDAKTVLFPLKYKNELLAVKKHYNIMFSLRYLFFFRRFVLYLLNREFKYIFKRLDF